MSQKMKMFASPTAKRNRAGHKQAASSVKNMAARAKAEEATLKSKDGQSQVLTEATGNMEKSKDQQEALKTASHQMLPLIGDKSQSRSQNIGKDGVFSTEDRSDATTSNNLTHVLKPSIHVIGKLETEPEINQKSPEVRFMRNYATSQIRSINQSKL